MRRWTTRANKIAAAATAAAAMAAALALASPADADPFDRRHVPADAKWVVHVDVDAARGTPLMKTIQFRLDNNRDAKDSLYQVTAATGTHVPDDVHDVTLYGRERGDQAVVVVAHLKIDRAQTMATARRAANFTLHTVGGHEVAGWTDGSGPTFGAFHDDSTIVIAHTEASVTAALDALDGKGDVQPADGPLAGTTPATTRPVAADKPVIYLAVTDLPSLVGDDNPLPAALRQVQGGSLAVAEAGETTTVRVNLTATTADAADQLRTAGEGVRAMVQFVAAGQNADPKAKTAAELVKTVVLGRADKTVTADLSLPTDRLLQLVDDMVQSSAGASGVHVKVEINGGGATHQHDADDK